jgi:hypothetical protein
MASAKTETHDRWSTMKSYGIMIFVILLVVGLFILTFMYLKNQVQLWQNPTYQKYELASLGATVLGNAFHVNNITGGR